MEKDEVSPNDLPDSWAHAHQAIDISAGKAEVLPEVHVLQPIDKISPTCRYNKNNRIMIIYDGQRIRIYCASFYRHLRFKSKVQNYAQQNLVIKCKNCIQRGETIKTIMNHHSTLRRLINSTYRRTLSQLHIR